MTWKNKSSFLEEASFAELSVLTGCLQECTFLCVHARDCSNKALVCFLLPMGSLLLSHTIMSLWSIYDFL